MQGLELPNPPLVAATDLLPAHDQPSSPPTPPGPVYQFPEPEDTTGQARRRATTGLGTATCMPPRVLCRVVSTSAPSIISGNVMVYYHSSIIFLMSIICICVGCPAGSGSDITYVVCALYVGLCRCKGRVSNTGMAEQEEEGA